MAIEITRNPQKITLVGTEENEFYFDESLIPFNGEAFVEWVSGTSFQIVSFGGIDSSCVAVTSANPKTMFPVYRGKNIRAKGGAGGEVFNIAIFPIG
jgi:hypothetical protein